MLGTYLKEKEKPFVWYKQLHAETLNAKEEKKNVPQKGSDLE
jgi:hypothetical protein